MGSTSARMMVAALAAAGAILLSACGGNPGPVANVTPPAAASPSPTPSPSPDPIPSPSASPSPSPTAIPKPVISITSAGKSLACRLPVTWEIQVDDFTRLHKSGFITFPTGKLTEDTSAPKMTMFYDRAYSKWLPVWRENVSPDGRRYAYTEGNPLLGEVTGKVHIVDVASGADRVLYSGSPIFAVVEFAREGIYMTASSGEGRGRGLWLVDPAGGAPHLVSRSLIAPFVADGVIWGADFNTADKHPALGGLEGPMNEVVRLNPASGATTRWFYLPGADLFAAGFDQSGHPIINAYSEPSLAHQIWLITSPTTATKVFDSTAGNSPGAVAAQDRHGVWFDGPSSPPGAVWLYDDAALRLVATTTAETFVVAGGCIP